MRRGLAVWDSGAAMAFPEFEPNKRKVLFFCRGRGSGHAIPDIEITNELLRLRGDVEVRFVSYATGAKTLAEFGFPVIDLGLPELNSLLDVIVLATKVPAGCNQTSSWHTRSLEPFRLPKFTIDRRFF